MGAQRLRAFWLSSPASLTTIMTDDLSQSVIAMLRLSSQLGVMLSTTLMVNGLAVRAQWKLAQALVALAVSGTVASTVTAARTARDRMERGRMGATRPRRRP